MFTTEHRISHSGCSCGFHTSETENAGRHALQMLWRGDSVRFPERYTPTKTWGQD